MNEAVTKRFLLYFRLMLLVWILIVNSILHVVGFAYSWLIFLSNIMLFTMEGDIKDRLLFVLIILHPYAPKVLNNVGFAYLTVACIDAETFAANLPLFFATYILGSLAFNGVCVLLMKPAKALAVKSVQCTQSETA